MVAATGAARYANRAWSVFSTSILAALIAQAAEVRTAAAQDDPNSAETAAARGLAVEGLKLADAGRCADAIDKLTRAEKLHHSSIVQGRLGECQISVGKIVDGTENLRKVLREAVPANPSPALLKTRERAQTALDAAKPKIAFLTISVKGPADVRESVVTVDGQVVPPALLDADRPTDPGDHIVEATAPGYLKASARVSLKEADKRAVSIRLDADPNAAPVAAAPQEPANAPAHPPAPHDTTPPASRDGRISLGGDTAPPPSGPPNRTAAYVSWAIGGVALAVGAGFGFVAMKGKSDLESKCPGDKCPRSEEEKINDAKSAGNISTIGFAVAGVGLALGTVLYFTASPTTTGARDRSLGQAHLTAPSGLRVTEPRAFIGVGQVGFAANF